MHVSDVLMNKKVLYLYSCIQTWTHHIEQLQNFQNNKSGYQASYSKSYQQKKTVVNMNDKVCVVSGDNKKGSTVRTTKTDSEIIPKSTKRLRVLSDNQWEALATPRTSSVKREQITVSAWWYKRVLHSFSFVFTKAGTWGVVIIWWWGVQRETETT